MMKFVFEVTLNSINEPVARNSISKVLIGDIGANIIQQNI